METLTEKKLGFSSLKRNWVYKAEKKLGFSRLKRNWVSNKFIFLNIYRNINNKR
jgi:hypothetical protein